jgi:hypothetical protein
MNKNPDPKDLLPSAMELAQLLKSNRDLLEEDLYRQGNEVVTIFHDPQTETHFQNLRDLKIDVIAGAIEDLAVGGGRLLMATVGVALGNNQLRPYIDMLGAESSGKIVFSIGLRRKDILPNWRVEDNSEGLPQEDINAGIYRLTAELAEII